MSKLISDPNLNGLSELSDRQGVDIRPTLFRVMTDLYLQKSTHTEEEERHYTELALRLIERVDANTCAVIASKLAAYKNAPPIVRARLARTQLIQKLGSGNQSQAAAQISEHQAAARELSELFISASAGERRLILLNLPYSQISPAKPVERSTAQESVHRLEAAALSRNSEVFAREIERMLSIPHLEVRRLIGDLSGEPIVVFATTLQMSVLVLQRILLCLNPAIGQSVQRVYDLTTLYEEVTPDAALRLVAIWQAAFRLPRNQAVPQNTVSHQRTNVTDPRPRTAAAMPRSNWSWQASAKEGKKIDSA
jgi:hypothetical protein